eukprot:TRINITY_DN12537_c0_g1_i4.p1 TRINITY_DN12537_c0_g1~~TRINITY_DN12537_c0_g1_i4.p1  ORF type:complete len:241 (+),score=56.00 TRINITY_DN12537_c0_g1_i4:113-835(+)
MGLKGNSGFEVSGTADTVGISGCTNEYEAKTTTHKSSRFGSISSGWQNLTQKIMSPRTVSQSSNNVVIPMDGVTDANSFHSTMKASQPFVERLQRTPRSSVPLESFKEQARKRRRRNKEELSIARRTRLVNEMLELRKSFNKKGAMAVEDILRKEMAEKGKKELCKLQLMFKKGSSRLFMTPRATLQFKKTVINEQEDERLKEALQDYLEPRVDREGYKAKNSYKIRNSCFPINLLRKFC